MRDVEDTDKEDGSNKHDVAEAHHEQGPGHLHLTTLDLLSCLEYPGHTIISIWTILRRSHEFSLRNDDDLMVVRQMVK